MSVIVLINIIVPVYASAADVADNNSSVYIGNGLWNGIAYSSSETQYIIKTQDIIMKFSPIRK